MSRRTLKQAGRALVKASNRDARNDATLDGVRPRKGLWLIHRGRGRVYGRIERVKRDGSVVWRGPYGLVVSRAIVLIDGGYSYVEHAHREGVSR